ncbi:SigE family RNA polymerase sigma factor [Amycolatopsis sp. NBC_00348]|uniref:sigma factor n=1 Tax=Amycolatopsis sp. NBC_00348 TaxID=2975956 RepID=UPI002E2546D5
MGASRELDFSEYFAARVQRFRRVAFALCGDWHSAEDLVQAMFVQLYRRWRRVRPDTVDAYARRILLNAFLAGRRKAGLRQPPPNPFHVTDERGTGSVYFLALLDDASSGGASSMVRCGTAVPSQVSCEVEQLKEGGLRKVTERANGVLTYRASLTAPGMNVEFWSSNSGVLEQKGVPLPVQRPEPTLNAVQVRGLALTPGLG